MKKKVLSIVLLAVLCCFTAGFAACNGNNEEPPHEHTYSSVWSSDGKYHWHVATCGHDVISDKAEHNGNPCTVCGYESIPEHEHTFSDEWESDETYHWHPSTCGHDVVSGKAEHIWDGGVVTKEPTCTEKGEKTYTCTVCDKTKKEEIAASGHTFSDEWESNETHHWHPSTCGHDVVSDKAEHTGNPCTVCGYENIPEHEHSLEYHAAKPVTCTENGNIEYWECSGCHKYFSDEKGETEITDKNSVIIVTEGHKWGEWETVKQATCTEEGKKERQCSACTEKENEPIPALNHIYGEWQTIKEPTCTEEGKKERQCSACTEKENEPIPALNHIYGEWQTIKEPTCTEEGKKERICSRCSHSETETLPVIAHTYDGYIKNSEYHWQKCSVCQNESEREPHNFVDGVCSVCNYDSRFSFELDFKLTGDHYTVSGMGDCTDKEIKIPESYEGKPVQAIAANAFWGKTDITSLNIPKSITSIGDNAFQNCTGLEEISIENKDIELGAGAFLGCEKITWASCPAFVVSEIAVTNLTILVVIDGELENDVLSDAKNLVSLTVPDITTTLGAVCGANTAVLESLTLAETTEIAENAFKNFTALKEINLPEGINSIGADAFLNTAYYNDSSNWVFNVLYLDSYLLKANTQITGYYPINNDTTVIANAAFSSCNGLTNVYIPDCVTSIGGDAFYNCSGLTSIIIPFVGEKADGSGATHFGYIFGSSYYNDDNVPESLKEVIITGGTSIGNYAFDGCSGLTSITIPESMTSIGAYAFYGCSGLTSITIPNSVTSIGSYAFYNCSGLTSITIPESVTSIEKSTFFGCSGLTSITIPESVTSIEDSAFQGCSGLTNITIPDSIKSIGGYAFSGCSGLTSITIPESVTSIENGTFSGCSELTSITIPESVTSIGSYAFDGCSGLTSITIPESVTSIGDYAFRDCSGLTSIIIPDGVTSIGSYTFQGCSGLTNITIPESVTSIGGFAFDGCSRLTIYCEAESKPSGWSNVWNPDNRHVFWGYKNQ